MLILLIILILLLGGGGGYYGYGRWGYGGGAGIGLGTILLIVLLFYLLGGLRFRRSVALQCVFRSLSLSFCSIVRQRLSQPNHASHNEGPVLLRSVKQIFILTGMSSKRLRRFGDRPTPLNT